MQNAFVTALLVLVVTYKACWCQSQQCPEANCILPQPEKELHSTDLTAISLEVGCYLGCLDKVSQQLSNLRLGVA